jgi:hypothetical protein
MNTNVTEKPLAAIVPLCKEPALIRVLTVSPKVVEQLQWTHEIRESYEDFWAGKEIIGRLVPGGLLVRDPNLNKLFRLGDLLFLQYRSRQFEGAGESHTEAIKQAQAELGAFPQVFAV